MEENIKQEGEFKINSGKKKPNVNFNKKNNITKVDLSIKDEDDDTGSDGVTKVVIKNDDTSNNDNNSGSDANNSNNADNKATEEEIARAKEEELKIVKEAEAIAQQANNAVDNKQNNGVDLPENIEKLVAFINETGGTVEDYVRLNVDYSTVKDEVLLKEYYKKKKPYLSPEEIDFQIEDDFTYDEDLDDERDIRKKKIAFKEEVERAKEFLGEVKTKYYDEIKNKKTASSQDNEANEFFNRYKKEQEKTTQIRERFKMDTNKFFGNEFKGFEFGIGDKKINYGVADSHQLMEKQSDISNFVGKFLDKEGNITDTAGYHKALYTAMNADKVAQHFYEQGKSDAIKGVVENSKNPSISKPRTSPGDVFVNGLKVKSVSGLDSSKLRIKTKKFN